VTKRHFLLLALLTSASCSSFACNTDGSAAVSVAEFRKDFDGRRQLRGPLTAAQVEKEVIERMRRQSPDRVPVPSTSWYDAWNRLKSKARPQDRFFWFSSPKESWAAGTGYAGYALVCDRTVIGTVVVAMQ
jgi:hypothetical protein